MMRKLPLIFSGLFFALPAVAQEAEPSAVPGNEQPEVKTEAPAAKPAEAKPATTAEATVKTSVAAEPAAPTVKAASSQATTVSGPAVVAADNSWKFEYHGYIRAPMRVGIGKRDNPGAGQSTTTFHSPIIPDDQYLSWQSSPHNKTDWAELFLSLGNSFAKGTVSIEHSQVIRADLRSGAESLIVVDASRPNQGPSSPVVSDISGHQRLVEDFADAVRLRREPLCSGAEGRRSLVAARAIYESARTGRVVDVMS